MRRSIAPWWVFPCAASFLAYFALLVYCDIRRPVPEGMELKSSGRPGLLVTEVTPGSPAALAGIRVDDRVLSADGRPVESRTAWAAVQANVAFDSPVSLEILRGSDIWRAEWRVTRAGWDYWRHREGIDLLVTRLVQLITLALGLVVVFRRPFDAGARLGGWLLATFGVYCIVLPYRFAEVWRTLPYGAGSVLWLPAASISVAPALLLSFFLSFPRRGLRSGAAWAAIWFPAVLIAAAHVRFLAHMVYWPDPGRLPTDWFGWQLGVSIGYLAAVVALVKYRRADPVERRRLGVLLLGGGVGAVIGGPIALAYWRGSETTLFASPAVALATLALLVVPLSFAYATLRHRLFDVRFIIRRGVQYALARRLLVSVVPVVLVTMAADIYWYRDRSIGEQFGARAPIYGGLAVLALVASRRRRRWLDALDRRFFRERYDAQRLLHQVSEDVRSAGSLHQAAGLVVEQIERALHPTFATLLSRAADGDAYRAVATAPASAGPQVLPGGAKLCALARLLGKPLDLSAAGAGWLAERLPPAEAAMVGDIGLELLVPIDAGPGRPDAILALGARRSEEPYAKEDQQLLWTVAESLAVLDARERSGPGGNAAFSECPKCGACYDPGASTCAGDAAALTVVGLPRVLSQRYRLEQRLGRGGMGVVYAASDLSLDRSVAVKVLREELVGDRESAARFEREARISASFSHPNVVTVFDFGVVGESRAFLVMERLEGTTLREEIGRGPLDTGRVLTIMRGVCEAVDAAHRRQLIHRDLKPENVFLAHGDGAERPKILDFGIAKALAGSRRDDEHQTTIGVLLGTRQYMAPEQLRGESPEPSWDIWALALIVHEMLTGYHPFSSLAIGLTDGGVPTAQPMPGRDSGPISPMWQPFFSRWLAIDPAERPGGAGALLDDLEQMLSQG
jgi:tRNA A-37 threonylcarbamoyl transferase component Bud32